MRPRTAAAALIAVAGLVLLGRHAEAATSPFGIATPDGTGGFGGPLGPLFVWIALRQAEFYRSLTAMLSSIKENGFAVWGLLGLSFLYGVFHAAGPGHGKAVISAYLVSSGETAKRGIALSFAAAFVQALTAVAVVTVAAVVLRVTAVAMTRATDWFEIASYALVAVVGAWLLWSKIFGGHHHHHHHPVAGGHDDGHDHHHDHHDHDHHHDGAGHDHAHGAACAHGHVHLHHAHDHDHAPAGAGRSASLAATHASAAPGGSLIAALGRAWSAILAVGIRPCSGAIIVLVFALSQGLYAAGILATFVMALGTGVTVAVLATLAVSARGLAVRLAGPESASGERLVRGAEILAAAAVMVFGLAMLGGALVAGLPGSG
jgi:nickel/cobalt exporter